MLNLNNAVTLLHGDVADVLSFMPDHSVSAVITDPPYALSMGGDMGKWDTYTSWEFASWCESWGRELVRIVRPGGWVLAFGAPRTWHRLTQGIEDAGLEILDSIDWVYPSGLMRSVNIPERLAKAGSPERAAQLAGRGTALHSRHEPAVLARAPLKGGLLATVAEFGTATLGLSDREGGQRGDAPNVVVQHSSFCGGSEDDLECVVGCPVPRFGKDLEYFPTFRFEGKPSKQERPRIRVESGAGTEKLSSLGQTQVFSCAVCGALTQSYLGAGGRYATLPHPVCSHDSYVRVKENFSSVNSHSTVKPLSLMRWLVRLLTVKGDVVLDLFAGSGSTVEAAVMEGRQVVAVERDLSSIELCRVRLRRSGCFRSGDGVL